MTGYDAEWESSGHFPSSKKSRPVIPKKTKTKNSNDGNNKIGSSNNKFAVNESPFAKNLKKHPIVARNDDDDDVDPIFTDEDVFDTTGGAFDTLATIHDGSLGIAVKSNDSLMDVSHASSETPGISNTTTAVVRNALRKSKELKRAGNDGRIEKIYPHNSFLSDGNKNEGQRKNDNYKPIPQRPAPPPRQLQRRPKPMPQLPSSSQLSPKIENYKGAKDNNEQQQQPKTTRSPPVRIAPLIAPVLDEPSSVITEEHSPTDEEQQQQQQQHNQYLFDYMAEGDNIQPPMSVMSVRSRRYNGGSKHHMVRQHTLPTSQKLNANPSNMLSNLFISIEAERHLHRLAAQHFRAIHNWLLFLPSIFLTLLAGLVVLIFEADIEWANADSRVYSSVAVGILSLSSVFLQALTKQLQLDTKSALHEACSTALKRLSEDILLTVSAATETIPAEYVALIGEKYGQAADACPLAIPYKLEMASSQLSDRMALVLNGHPGQAAGKLLLAAPPRTIDRLRLYATAYDELSAEILHHFAFPFGLPDPRRASKIALRNFTMVTEGREADRRWWKSNSLKSFLLCCCPCLGDDEERSLLDIKSSNAVVLGVGDGVDHHHRHPITGSSGTQHSI